MVILRSRALRRVAGLVLSQQWLPLTQGWQTVSRLHQGCHLPVPTLSAWIAAVTCSVHRPPACTATCSASRRPRSGAPAAQSADFSVMQKGRSMLHQLTTLHCVWQLYSGQGHSVVASCAHGQAS